LLGLQVLILLQHEDDGGSETYMYVAAGVIEDQYGYFPKLELWPCQL
jgi:hypothetical protein